MYVTNITYDYGVRLIENNSTQLLRQLVRFRKGEQVKNKNVYLYASLVCVGGIQIYISGA